VAELRGASDGETTGPSTLPRSEELSLPQAASNKPDDTIVGISHFIVTPLKSLKMKGKKS